MNVSLTPELEQFVHQKVESGMYHSASEVIREGLRMLRERDEIHRRQLESLRRDVQIGIDEADRGATRPLTRALVDDIKARGRMRRPARSSRDKA